MIQKNAIDLQHSTTQAQEMNFKHTVKLSFYIINFFRGQLPSR